MPGQQRTEQTKTPTIKNSYVYGDGSTTFFTNMMPTMMGFFVFFFVFLISGMALLKERTSGTLTRLLATPVRRSEIVFGYTIGYGVLALIQSTIIVLFSVYVLNIEVTGSVMLLIAVSVLLAMVALAFGLLMSTFAKSEFQMMQFIPVIVIPQIFFSGIIPLANMATWAQWLSDILPMKYAANAMNDIVFYGSGWSGIMGNVLILGVFLVVLLGLNIFGLKRYRKV
ncbi:ABC transporter DrrB family efflux protein [Weissella uvarum]|nr:ABC transporter DrrB family efflux protein [Weissella uvarum]